MPAKKITVTGKVQGVFFRATAKETADSLGITGTARNCLQHSNKVRIVAEGSDSALKQFIDWCQEGSANAEVEDVETEETDEMGWDEFKIVR